MASTPPSSGSRLSSGRRHVRPSRYRSGETEEDAEEVSGGGDAVDSADDADGSDAGSVTSQHSQASAHEQVSRMLGHISTTENSGSENEADAGEDKGDKSDDDDDDVESDTAAPTDANQDLTMTQKSQITIQRARAKLRKKATWAWTAQEMAHALEAVEEAGVFTMPAAGRKSKRGAAWETAFNACHAVNFETARKRRAEKLKNLSGPEKAEALATWKDRELTMFKARVTNALNTYRTVPGLEAWETGGKDFVDADENPVVQKLFELYHQERKQGLEAAQRTGERESTAGKIANADKAVQDALNQDPDASEVGPSAASLKRQRAKNVRDARGSEILSALALSPEKKEHMLKMVEIESKRLKFDADRLDADRGHNKDLLEQQQKYNSDRMSVEKDRMVLEKDRMVLEKDRLENERGHNKDFLEQQERFQEARIALERDRLKLESSKTSELKAEMSSLSKRMEDIAGQTQTIVKMLLDKFKAE